MFCDESNLGFKLLIHIITTPDLLQSGGELPTRYACNLFTSALPIVAFSCDFIQYGDGAACGCVWCVVVQVFFFFSLAVRVQMCASVWFVLIIHESIKTFAGRFLIFEGNFFYFY